MKDWYDLMGMSMQEKNEYLNTYYSNEAHKLRKMVDKILLRFGGINDYDNFYSLANEVFVQAMNDYDGRGEFDGFLSMCLANKIKTEITRLNRQKRSADRESVSLNAPVNAFRTDGDEDLYLEDCLSDNVDIENDVLGSGESGYSEQMLSYLNSLTEEERQILNMMAEGYKPYEIRKKLQISERDYNRSVADLKSFGKIDILIRRNSSQNHKELREMDTLERESVTYEKTKNDYYTVAHIDREMRALRLRDDHVLQRSACQWNNWFKSELISDVLGGKALTQIIVSEEIKNGIQTKWIIDGKQRCAALREYIHDGFQISRNVGTYMIEYQTLKVDENGEYVKTEEGFSIPEVKTFDIRGKKFSKLPQELQDTLLEYKVPVLLNLNCSKKEIAKDIARFNRCAKMNVAQNGWLGLDEAYADLVDDTLRMSFFKPDCEYTSFTARNATGGTLRRVAIEAITISRFPGEFNKEFRKICNALSQKASDETFVDFYDNISRLSDVATHEVAEFFNAKDAAMWIALFDKFTELGQEDDKFIEFLVDFKNRLHAEKINGVSYDDLAEDRDTKGKNKIIAKLNLLISLMKEYFKIGTNANDDMTEWFISETTGIDREKVTEDIELYEQTLDDFEDRYVGQDSKLREPQNRPSLLAMVAYMYEEDVDIEDWFSKYVLKEHFYLHDQKQNYQRMLNDLSSYGKEEQIAS